MKANMIGGLAVTVSMLAAPLAQAAAQVIELHQLPSVSGGGLTPGVTKDYAIELKPGEYVYSCPLNPTPDYRLIVGN